MNELSFVKADREHAAILAEYRFKMFNEIYPPIIFHAFINYFAIFSSWGYYLGN